MKSPICLTCRKPAVETRATIRFRRGEGVLPVETVQWRCPGECAGPRGEVPYVFADLATMKANEARAREAWREAFGDEMPPPRRAGRPTNDPLTERLQVRLSNDEVVALDARRGDLSRSEFVRRALVGARIQTLDAGYAFRLGRRIRRPRHRGRDRVPLKSKGAVPVKPPESWSPGALHG